jgi:pyrimidine-nucleoside phosphorylase
MNPVEIIIKKRDGNELTPEEISFLVNGFTRGDIPDYQMSGFLMAVFLNGMTGRETAHLTFSMMRSGTCLDLSSIGRTVDKHSTGGVGDKVKLVLVPLAASCGAKVPTTFGRGLGHTGGTRDKLESIPGFRTALSKQEIFSQLKKIGAVMIGTSEDIAPADKKIYALRDVTGTVPSIPLITSSVLSKKFAGGADAFVFDVKTGSGAFMRSAKDAEKLAKLLVSISRLMKKKAVAVISGMDQPLGNTVGNILEMVEAVETLKGRGPADLRTLTIACTAHLLVLAGIAKDFKTASAFAAKNLSNGSALKKFLEIVKAQGGDTSYIEDTNRFKKAAFTREIRAAKPGYITGIDAYETGMTAHLLGAGRLKLTDTIDHEAGIILFKKVGGEVSKGEPVCALHTNRKDAIDEAAARMQKAIAIAGRKAPSKKLIIKTIRYN